MGRAADGAERPDLRTGRTLRTRVHRTSAHLGPHGGTPSPAAMPANWPGGRSRLWDSLAFLAASVSLFAEEFTVSGWADALSYAEGSGRIWGGTSPYSAMQLAGPYWLDAAAWGRGFVYPPSGALLLVPFTLGEAFFYAWNLLSIAALVAVVLLIVRRELGRLPFPAALGIAAVALAHPAMAGLRTGYMSPMVAAAVGAMWLWPRWSAIPALLFGAIKVYPLMGLVWTVRTEGCRRHSSRHLGGSSSVGDIGSSTPGYWTDWLRRVGKLRARLPGLRAPSFACAGRPASDTWSRSALLIGAWGVRNDRLSFAFLGLAMTVRNRTSTGVTC